MMMPASLEVLLAAARARRDAGDWAQAIRLFRQAEQAAPQIAEIKHNLAIAHLATRDRIAARRLAEQAIAIAPGLWQSHALLARIHREGGDPGQAEGAWAQVLAYSPGNGTALLGLADLAMNEFGDPESALRSVEPLRDQPSHAADAELTALMALLYTGGIEAEAMTARLVAFSRANLRLPRLPARPLRSGRRRVGLISPLFSASPVHYLTWSTWEAVRRHHDIVVLDRGTRADWATEKLRAIAGEWLNVAHLEPPPLAKAIAAAEIDVLFDLGGWSDVAGLAALSARPAARMYKWVGGQSATTGLDMFDGWIGDAWQSPPEQAALYAEPLVNIAGGYVDYSPPPVLVSLLASLRDLPRKGAALVGNPAKIGRATVAAWPAGVARVTLIDRRYAHVRTRERVTEVLARGGIAVDEVIVPHGQEAYLRALAGHEAIVNTQPYAAGLTAVEAHALGLRVLGDRAGRLFASRHHLSHARTGGRNPSLPGQILALIAR